MWHFLKNGAKTIFNKKQDDILSAAFVIAAAVALSRILGLIRYRLLAGYFGDEIQLLDGYFAATTLLDSIFETFIFGSIALAFIPVFSKYLGKEKLNKAWQLASTLMTMGFLCFMFFAVIFFFFSNEIAALIAPGLVQKFPETQAKISHLLQIMVLSQSLFVISIFLTGVLHSFKRFLIPSIASIFYNVGIISSIIFLSPLFGIYSAAIGMIFGALLHFLVQLPLILSLKFKFKFNLNLKDPDVKAVLILMWPRSITIGLTRLSDVVNVALASSAAVGSIVALNFAQVLQVVPAAFFAASIAQAAFVFMSIEYNKGKKDQFKSLFLESLHQILFLVLPAAAILAVLRVPVVRLVFGAKDLPWETTVLASRTLLAFSIGISAAAVNLLLTRGFHAVRDSYTPVKISLVTTSLNIALAFIFILGFKLSIIYLAVAYSISNILAFVGLMYFLDKKVGGFDRAKLLIPTIKMIIISVLTAVALYIPMKFLDQLVFDTTKVIGLIVLTSIASASGLAVYILLSWIFKVEQLAIFTKFGKRVITFPSRLNPPSPTAIGDVKNQT
ncbi:MAG: lipid II flippase MurJ [Patescibacteria group bacterium]